MKSIAQLAAIALIILAVTGCGSDASDAGAASKAPADITMDATTSDLQRASIERMAEASGLDPVDLRQAMNVISRDLQGKVKLTGSMADRHAQAQAAIADRVNGLAAEQILELAESLRAEMAAEAERNRAAREAVMEKLRALSDEARGE